MKKKTIIPVLCLPLILSSCSFMEDWNRYNSSSNSSSKQSSSGETSSQESISSEESSSSDNQNKTLKTIMKDFVKLSYYTGDIYAESVEARIIVYYTDGTSEKITKGLKITVMTFKSQDEYECSATTPVLRAGKYTSKIKVSYTHNDVTKSFITSETNTFYSVLEEGIDECVSFTPTMLNSYVKHEKVLDKLHIQLDITWKDHGREIYLLTEEKEYLTLMLNSDENPHTNIIDSPLLGGTTYHLVLTIGEVSNTIDFQLANAYVRVDKSELTMTAHELDDYNSPIVENPKILVIPVNLKANKSSDIKNWTESSVNTLNTYYFGDYPTSFVNYYKAMSIGYMNFDGMVADIYTESSDLYTVDTINNDTTTRTLYQMMNRALEATLNKYPDVDWSEYDQDNNGTFDNIHILTNYNATVWAGNLWPHQSSIGNISGTHNRPCINTYSIGAINHTNNAITQIHEQGHIFGLADYYDYSDDGSSSINYVGGADMQSHNMFDWNSYSKLSVGLLSPYVVTGGEDDFTMEIGDAVTTGDCIIVPANYDTWNGSAFDEYFLIELFSNKGINSEFWSTYNSYYGNLGNFGIRMYHVDSRLYDIETGHEVSLDKSTWGNYVIVGPNNSKDYTAYGYGDYNPSECADFKQLVIIQAGGEDTFGASGYANHYLRQSDMFQTGDTFTFSEYSHFLSKEGQHMTTMDNGESFTWNIDFQYVGLDSARIRFYK